MAGANIGHGRVVVDRLGPHAFDDGQLIDNLGSPGQQLADPGAGLAILLELVLRGGDGKAGLAARHRRQALTGANRIRQILVEENIHLRLVVEEVHLRRALVHEQVDGPLRLGCEVRQAGQTADGARGMNLAGRRGQDRGQGCGAEAEGGLAEEMAAGDGLKLFLE